MNRMRATTASCLAFLSLLGIGASSDSAAGDATVLSTVKVVRHLSAKSAATKIPIRLRALVTFFDRDWRLLFVQDAGIGIYVESIDGLYTASGGKLVAGSLVEIEGYSGEGLFAPIIFCRTIRVEGHAVLPEPRPLALDEFHGGREDSQWVTVSGVVRRAKILDKHLELQIASSDRAMLVYIPNVNDDNQASALVDAAVTISGVCATEFKNRKWLGSRILAPSLQQLRVRRPGTADPFGLPTQPLESVGAFRPEGEPGHRVKVAGVVSWNDGVGTLYLQDDFAGLRVRGDPLRLQATAGDRVNAVGFPVLGAAPHLVEGEIRVVEQGPPPGPSPLDTEMLLDAKNNSRLITVEGRLLECRYRDGQMTLELQATRHDGEAPFNFQAHLTGSVDCPAPGSWLRLTGIANVLLAMDRPLTLDIQLRSGEDLLVLQRPAWWTVTKALSVAAVLTCASLIGLAWIVALRRQVRRQTQMLREHSERLQGLTRKLITAQEAERAHLARELHDEFAQVLTTINFRLGSLKGQLDAKSQSSLDNCTAIVRQAIDQVRSLALDLRPTMLDILGLEPALHWLARHYQEELGGGTTVEFKGQLEQVTLPPEVSIACFRIVQEALTNAVKHAGARHVVVELRQDAGNLRLLIRDDGIGFDVASVMHNVVRNRSFGLLGMQERVQLLGGSLAIESAPGQGSRISANIPVVR